MRDSMKLFNAFVRPIFRDPKGNAKDQIDKILKKTGGHPLSIEIIAKNIRSLHQLENILLNFGRLQEDSTRSEKRFQTLRACFDYTINILDETFQELLHKLAFFSSPFPISGAVEIFGASENDILDLYDRSLLTLVDSDERYGKVQDYWLHNFHPAVRNYVQDIMRKKKEEYELKIKYGKKYSTYYHSLLKCTYDSIGKENHIPSLARFNIILQGEYNDFERAAELTDDKKQSANIQSYFGLMVTELGMLTKAKECHSRSKEIFEEIEDSIGTGVEYYNLGDVLSKMGNNLKALDYLRKAMEIHEGLGDRVSMARDYANLGVVLSETGNKQQDYLKRALEIHEGLGDRVSMARDYGNMGLVLSETGNKQQALDYLRKDCTFFFVRRN